MNLPELRELTIGNIRYEIGIGRAKETRYGGVRARLIPKDNDSEAIECYIGKDGKLYILQGDIKITQTCNIEYESYLKFPTVGKKGLLYIDTSTNIAYRYSEEDLKYYPVSGITLDNLESLVNDIVEKTVTTSIEENIQVINGNRKPPKHEEM